MIKIRKSQERGLTQTDWLKSLHSFSFADYHDRNHMGVWPLRVINEDWVAPGKGFHPHPHDNMEIITWVVDGALAHKDSMGNGSSIRPYEAQLLSAGTGVVHSEFNASATDDVHLLQIWIRPHTKQLPPSYQQKSFLETLKFQQTILLVSENGEQGSLSLHQDAKLWFYHGQFDPQHIALQKNRQYWWQLIKGQALLNQSLLHAGDAAHLIDEPVLQIEASQPIEALLFDLPVP